MFSSQDASGARFGAGLKRMAAGLALAAGLAFASAAQAATVWLDVGKMDHARTVNISGMGRVSAAPAQFKTIYDGRNVDLIAWCVDVYHSITMKDYTPNLEYTDTKALTTDFSPAANPLSDADLMKVGLLANYGQALFDGVPVAPAPFTQAKPVRSQFPAGTAGTNQFNAALAAYNASKAAYNTALAAYNASVSDRYTRLSAVQAAIWQVTSKRDVTSANGDTGFDTLVDNLSGDNLRDYFASGYGNGYHGFTLITPVQQFGGKNGVTKLPLTQSFVFATGAIPEPATWLLMIVGFGSVGAVLRRRTARAAA